MGWMANSFPNQCTRDTSTSFCSDMASVCPVFSIEHNFDLHMSTVHFMEDFYLENGLSA